MKRVGMCVVASAALLAANTATAESWQLTVAPSVDLAFKKSDFSFDFGGSGADLVNPTYTTLTPSAAVSVGPIYGVLSYEVTVNPWNSETLSMYDPGTGPIWTITQDSYERSEAALTIGYRVYSGGNNIGPVNVFVGYLNGNSAWRSTDFTYDTSVVPSTYQFSVYRYIFSENGGYIGANYSQPFGEKGTLSLSAAYALLDGNLGILSSWGDNFDYISDATGYSLGITWTGPITGNLNYRVGMKHVKYDFNVTKFRDNISGTVTVLPSWFDFSIHEEMNSFFFGVSAYF